MASLVLDLNKRYTYADYLTWTDDKMRELIDGFIRLSPAPKLKHQKISGIIFVNLFKIIENSKGKCEVFHAPFDVRRPENGEKADEQIYNVVQPDICMVCDSSKLDENGCIGAPDLIVEVLSKSSERRDAIEKKALYEKAGVKEYWIVYPNDEIIYVYILLNEKYEYHNVYGVDDKIPVHMLNGYVICYAGTCATDNSLIFVENFLLKIRWKKKKYCIFAKNYQEHFYQDEKYRKHIKRTTGEQTITFESGCCFP